MAHDRLSIIVLGHNRFFETTDRCLASLSQDPEFASWEVVVVDNASDEESRDAFAQAPARYSGIKLFRSETNAGYPGGMNAGLRLVQGDPIVLVTNDVLVPAGTIGRLAAKLKSHPHAGLIGPVTNAAGNEQKIFIDPPLPIAAVMEQGHAFAEASPDGCMAAYRLDGCCVAMRRAVYEAIGGFDEAYSPGYYEDFDYSLRARKAGFELLVAENAFIYHEGGASFGRNSKEKKALIARNKRLFLAKHGRNTWLPHIRDGNIRALTHYAEQMQAGLPPPAYRIANRLKLAHTDMPKSCWKRWKYQKRVEVLEQLLAPALGTAGSEQTETLSESTHS